MSKSIKKITMTLVMSLFFYSLTVFAEYCAIGNIKGSVCKGFILESCKHVQIDAVKGDGDKLYTVNRCFDSVTEYSESKGRCWIRTKSQGGGLISWGINTAIQPEFLHLNEDGSYEALDVDYLTFKCQTR